MRLRVSQRWLWRGAAAVSLLLVFLAYLQPDLMVRMASELWACF